MPPPIMNEGPAKVWIVDFYIGLPDPKISEYTLLEKRKTGIKVSNRGFPKFIPPAGSRKFFYSKESLQEWLKKWAEEALATAERRLTYLRRLQAGQEELPVDTTPDFQRLLPSKLKLK